MLRDDREDKEEKKMSEEDLAAKMHILRQREQEQEKRDKAVVDLKQKMEDVYEQQKKIVDALSQPKESEALEGLGNKVEQIRKQQELFCDPKSGQCFVTKADLEGFLKEQSDKIPQILDGAQDLTSFFQRVSEEEPGGRLYKILSERMPTKLKVNLVKFLCGDDEECRIALEKDPDIKITNTGQRKPGLLGT